MVKGLKGNKFLWIAAGGALLLFYFIFDPVNFNFIPQCVFHKLTGLQCMGCGAQRMVHALLHGDIRGAMEANLFLFFSIPWILFFVWVEIFRLKFPGLYRKLHSVWVIITISAMLVAWLIVRNILGI